jgi:hypothetical protein
MSSCDRVLHTTDAILSFADPQPTLPSGPRTCSGVSAKLSPGGKGRGYWEETGLILPVKHMHWLCVVYSALLYSFMYRCSLWNDWKPNGYSGCCVYSTNTDVMAIHLVRHTTPNRFQIRSTPQFTFTHNPHSPSSSSTAQDGSRTSYQRCSGDAGWSRSRPIGHRDHRT